jgi:hypothetical protein
MRAYAFPAPLQNRAFVLKTRSCGDLIKKALNFSCAYVSILATQEHKSGHSAMEDELAGLQV